MILSCIIDIDQQILYIIIGQRVMPPCQDLFCGCEIITSYYDTDQPSKLSILLSIAYIIMITMITLLVNLKWFVYKDYYPLKQRSPILCMMLSVSICLNLLIYPILYLQNFFTYNIKDNEIKMFFRSFQVAIQLSPYLIYFVRGMRIVYAHQCTAKKSRIFQLFKKQAYLGIIIFVVCLLRTLPVIFNNYEEEPNNFRLLVELSAQRIDSDAEIIFLYHYFTSSFVMKLLLLYCLYLQRNVHPRYTMKPELVFIIVTEILSSLPIIGFSVKEQNRQIGILSVMCSDTQMFPLTEIIKTARLLCLLFISLISPLLHKKIYHKFLPTPRIQGFIKTMRDFLMQPQNLTIFQHFLKHQDRKNSTNINSSLLVLWKQLIVIRYKKDLEEHEKIEKIKNLIYNSNDETIMEDEKQLMIQLKSSIDDIFVQEDSSFLCEKYCQELNSNIKKLENNILTKLDRIYWDKYTKTESYYKLTEITSKNRNTNLNMIMLNMALIVDAVSEE